MTTLPARVRITEVGPRDGLQNEAVQVPTDVKAAFVRALTQAGHTDIEVTSFVRRDVVPQLADAGALLADLGPPPPGVVYGALVPNEQGLEDALAAGVGKLSVFTAASESFTEHNINATIEESLKRFVPVARAAKEQGLLLRGYISCAVACPYEGPIEPAKVLDVTRRLLDLGCDEVSVGDTIGAATPADVARLLDVLLGPLEPEACVMHFHDTRGMAVANVLESLRRGITAFDASSGGLGGCPFAPGASGNLATEDLLFLLDGLGIPHGIDVDRQRRASAIVAGILDHPLPGRVYGAPPLAPRTAR